MSYGWQVWGKFNPNLKPETRLWQPAMQQQSWKRKTLQSKKKFKKP